MSNVAVELNKRTIVISEWIMEKISWCDKNFFCYQNRSKTCPECRQKVTESKIGRIYLHYTSNDNVISSLQSKIAGLNHELLIKEIEIIESNSNNTKLSTVLKSKESELRRLEADLWIAREHNSLWKNHAQVEMAEHDISKKEVSRLTKELNDMKRFGPVFFGPNPWDNFANRRCYRHAITPTFRE